jgi:UDP-arabinose 4-epimerase
LERAGFIPVAYDSLVHGSEESVKWGPFIQGDLCDEEKLDLAFQIYKPIAVVHLAALRSVPESVKDPYSYYQTNVAGSLNLLRAMQKYGVDKIVFSSSCAIYGDTNQGTMDEETPKNPINPYSKSKWFFEQILEDFSHAYGLNYATLRYFNVAGMDAALGLKRVPFASSPPLIVSILTKVLQSGGSFHIYGTDYSTPDGTAVRDFIHVSDIARAHVLALFHLQSGYGSLTLNLGTGKGYSVKEVVQATEKIIGRQVPCIVEGRRPGDMPQAVADASRSNRILNFVPQCSDLSAIIESEWKVLQQGQSLKSSPK